MKVDFEAYREAYYQKQLRENWQSGILTLPFDSGNHSVFDRKNSLYGMTGEFLRLLNPGGSRFVIKDEPSLLSPIKTHLEELGWAHEQIAVFNNVVRDVFFVDKSLNIVKADLIKYYPLMPEGSQLSEREEIKRRKGAERVTQLLVSLLDGYQPSFRKDKGNIFLDVIEKALAAEASGIQDKSPRYYTFGFLQKMFRRDLDWLIGQEDAIVTKYLPLMLYFYLCIDIMQTIHYTSARMTDEVTACVPMYYILKAERASEHHDAVLKGWEAMMGGSEIEYIFGRTLAMDICNTILPGEPAGFYHEILEKMSATPFDDNREALTAVLEAYQTDKRQILSTKRKKKAELNDPIDVTIGGYNEFIEKLEYLCRNLQSADYKPRLKKKVRDVLGIRLLERRRSKHVLVLDNEMLIFLIAMITKGKRTKLEDLYKGFKEYGILFNRASRLNIEEYLLKLNLLDRKSDSGEAQYVTVVL